MVSWSGNQRLPQRARLFKLPEGGHPRNITLLDQARRQVHHGRGPCSAYREDTRRWSNGDIFRDILGKCARALVSRDWCGYWQGNHRLGESLAV